MSDRPEKAIIEESSRRLKALRQAADLELNSERAKPGIAEVAKQTSAIESVIRELAVRSLRRAIRRLAKQTRAERFHHFGLKWRIRVAGWRLRVRRAWLWTKTLLTLRR